MRLDSTQGRVPATVSVSPAGSQVSVSVVAKTSAGWVTVAKLRYASESVGTTKVKVPVGHKWSDRLAGESLKAKLVVAVTSPSGVRIDAVEGFRLEG